MLSYLRENTGNWIIKIFLGIIVVVFVFLGVGSFGSKRNDSIATINEESITLKEYQQEYKSIVEQMRARFGKNLNDDILKALNVKQQALDSLIEQKLILAQADKLEIMVSEKELQESLFAIKAFQKDGLFNMDQYKQVLGLNSLNPEIFELLQRNSIRQQKVKELVLNAVNVSDLEARDWYVFKNVKIALDYLVFDPKDYTDILPTQEQMNSFYTEHKDTYKSEPKLKAVYLKFLPEEYKEKVTITDAHIKDFYEQNPEQFKIPEKVEARHILIKVEEDAEEEKVNEALKRAQDIFKMAADGQDFESLAKEYSEGPSKDNGGYLGVFERQNMVKPFADQAFSMEEGEISNPVRTMFGWHLIQLIAKHAASVQTLAMASETIKTDLEKQEMQNLAYYKAGEAFDAVIDGDDFEQVALIANKKLVETKEFEESGQGLEMENSSEFAKAAFAMDTDTISDVKQLGDAYYLIKVIQKIDPVLQDFDLVKDRVLKELTVTLQNQKAKEDAQSILSKISTGSTMEIIARENNLSLKSTNLLTRNDRVEEVGNSPELIQAGFSLTEKNKIYPDLIEVSSKYYIIGFKAQKYPEESEILENLNAMKDEISWNKQSQYYQAWITELKNNSKIQYNPEILN